MRYQRLGGKILGTAAAGTALAGLALRPWFLRWGATDEEIRRTWPGDELSPEPASDATRAVTIHAPAAAVWPWILQLGQDRGGFYSYSWLENLVGARIRNADQIIPEYQSRAVGDTVWMAPAERYGGKGCSKVAMLEPERAMVLVSPDDFCEMSRTGTTLHGTWALLLDPAGEDTTRLVVRSRSGRKEGLTRFLLFDPIHFVMERKMMLGIRDRVEAQMRRARSQKGKARLLKAS